MFAESTHPDSVAQRGNLTPSRLGLNRWKVVMKMHDSSL